MVKNLPTVERSTKIRFGKNVPDSDVQAENTIVFNASNTLVSTPNSGSIYMAPVKFRDDLSDPDVVLMMYNRTTGELSESGESANALVGGQTLQATADRGNASSNTILFTNADTGFTTIGKVGIANSQPGHTLSIGSNVYIDDVGPSNVLIVNGGVSIDGNLAVNGGITTIRTENLIIEDAIIEIGKNNTSEDTTLDLGLIMTRPGSNVTVGFKEVENEMVLAYTQSSAYSNTITPIVSEDLDVHVYGGVLTESNVGIKTTSPDAELHVVGNVYVSSNLTVDTDTFHVDVKNKSVGIETKNPDANLHVVGNVYVSSNLSVDDDTLHVDVEADHVGVNTKNPNAELHVVGNAYVSSNLTVDTDTLHVDAENDAVGINTKNPTSDLHVVGNAYVSSTTNSTTTTTGALIIAGGIGVAGQIYGQHANLEDVEADDVTITDTTTSSSDTTGALKVAGGISTQENLNVGAVAKVLSTTDATSKTTGALIVTGGLGVSKNIHGKDVFVEDVVSNSVVILDTTTSTSVTTGALKVVGGVSTEEKLNVGGITKVWDGTDASSKTTGAVQIVGGLGVSKNIHGKDVFVEDVVSNSVIVLDTTESKLRTNGALIVSGGIGVASNVNTTNLHALGTTASASKTTGTVVVAGGVGISGALFGASANLEDVEADNLTITDDTTSTSKTTGAVTIAGGLGVSGPLFGAAATLDGITHITNTTQAGNQTTGALKVAGGLGVGGNVHCGHLTVSGNLTVTGNTTIINANNLVVKDPIIEIGKDNLTGLDTGILMNNPLTDGNKGNVAVIYDFSASNLEIGHTLSSANNSPVVMNTANTLAVNINGTLGVTGATESSSKVTGAVTIGGGLGVYGNVHSSNIFAGYDLDLTSYVGRAAVGFMGQTNHASFAHIDNNTTTSYAIKQTEGGTTHLNAKAGQHIRLNINNSEKARLTGDGDFFVDTDTLYVDAGNDRVGVNKAAPAYALDVVGDINSSAMVKGVTFTGTNLYGTLAGSNTVAASDITASGTVKGATLTGTNVYGTLAGSNTAAVSDLTASAMVKAATISGTNVYGTLAGSNTAAVSDLTASAMVKGTTITGTNLYGTLAGANTAAVTTLTASGMVKGDTISGTNVYGTLAGANTAAVTTLTASGMVKAATISGTNVYGTLAGANTAAVTTLTASGMVKGATISGTNVYGTLAGSNTVAASDITASGTVKGATLTGTNLYGTLAGSNTAAVSDLTASAMVKGATITGTNLYGTLAGSNAAAMTTLSASGVVTLTDTTEATSSTTGALKAAGGVGIAKDVYVGERAYVTGGLITNTGQVTKKTYSFTGALDSGQTIANSTIKITFSAHVFYAKVVAHLIESDDEVSTLSMECGGGHRTGGTPLTIAKGPTSVFGSASTNPWNIAVAATTTTVALAPTTDMAAAGNYNIFIEYISAHASGAVTKITEGSTDVITFGY